MAARFAVVIYCLMAFCGQSKAEDATPLSFGLISVQSRTDTEALWKPLLDGLSRRLHREVKQDIASDYAGIVWSMRAGRDQLAWTGNKDAIDAVDKANAEVFAQSVYASGTAGYYSYLIVRTALPYTTTDEVFAHAKESTLALGDLNSTSGYLVPLYFLFRPRIDPETGFKRVTHGSHEENFLAVAEGRADFAAIASNHFERIALAHPEAKGKTRVIWQSEVIPGDPVLWNKDLPDATKRQIQAFFVQYGTLLPDKSPAQLAEEKDALARLGLSRFIASTDRQLIPIRKIELLSGRGRMESNTAISEAERSLRLKEIDRQLMELDQPLPRHPSDR